MTKARFLGRLEVGVIIIVNGTTLLEVLRDSGQPLLRQIKVNASGVLAHRDPEYPHHLRRAAEIH